MKMFKVKDFEWWVWHVVSGHDPPYGRLDTGAGRLVPVSPTVGSLVKTPMSKLYLLVKRI